ncbi:MAG: ATP cone domain-containing protein, partial [Candidatus Hodarchaeota archaeon]
MYVTKADGSKQLFDQNKIVKTCLRLGASRRIAQEIVMNVEKKMYNG